MTNDELKATCVRLMKADTEDDVIQTLTRAGWWDDPKVWRYYGDKEGNFSAFGNQQSAPDAALVEKVVNSIDAVLMGECWARGISPEDAEAPRSIAEAVALYFSNDATKADTLGHVSYWPDEKRRRVSRLISVAATGARRRPCFTIADAGEGQTPDSMPSTLLSLDGKNKLRVQFVQGKFNMGGTGSLQFCGQNKNNLQLVVTRRRPDLEWASPSDDSTAYWGFTVVRREDPSEGRKNSTYTYLAPVDADTNPGRGRVPRFASKALSIFPSGTDAYGREGESGTLIKLYEYEATGFRSHMFLKDGLQSRLDLLLPESALPVRLHECRDFKGRERSFETTLTGLGVRLEDDRARNMEPDFPTSSPLMVSGEAMTAKIYSFKKGTADTYRDREGIIFTVNGQTHAHLPRSFFSRRAVGMGRLEDSILVSVDCTNLGGRAREDLFMNSRDRLRSGDFRKSIERALESLIRSHQGLKNLRERRRREDVESRLEDSKPMKEMLESILKVSPTLASLFGGNGLLPNPFRTRAVASEDKRYVGKPHPTYFKFQKSRMGRPLSVTAPSTDGSG